ncbi:MAG: acetyl-coenzyme A synthetase, partial [Crocinitomicaceae bacterium]|nr:acetyl-coenzyme A synthetase [Crocinitomicaceae bacterium]
MSYPYQIKSLEDYNKKYARSVDKPEQFWSEIAETFTWKKKWEKVLEWNFIEPSIKWFQGGTLNITENCIDRHLEKNGNSPAIIWESNNPDEHHRVLTYKELHFKVVQ